MSEKQFYTVKDIAERYRLDEATIYRMIRRNDVSYHRIGRVIRFSEKQVAAFDLWTLVPAREDENETS